MSAGNDPTDIPIKVRFGSHKETVLVDKSLDTAALSAMITGRTQIPAKSQKLIVEGIGMIKPGVDKVARPVQDLQGKKIILMGTPVGKALTEPVSNVDPAQVRLEALSTAIKERLIERLRKAESELRVSQSRFRTAEEALHGQIQDEEIEEGEIPLPMRRFGRLADLTNCTPSGILERLIGLGVIPRLGCRDAHNPCPDCIEVFLLGWMHLVRLYISDCIMEAERVRGDRQPTTEEEKVLLDLFSYQDDLDCEHHLWLKGEFTYGRGVVWYLVGEMIHDLELDKFNFLVANDKADGCLADINSFFTVQRLMSAGDDLFDEDDLESEEDERQECFPLGMGTSKTGDKRKRGESRPDHHEPVKKHRRFREEMPNEELDSDHGKEDDEGDVENKWV